MSNIQKVTESLIWKLTIKPRTGKDLWPRAPEIDFTNIFGPGEWFGIGFFEGNTKVMSFTPVLCDGEEVEIVCKRFNHSSPAVTMRYLGIEDKEVHNMLMNEIG